MKLITIPSALGSMGNCDTGGPDAVVSELADDVTGKIEIMAVDCPQDNLAEANATIYAAMRQIHEPFIALGGDHSITYQIVKSVQERLRKENKPDCGMIVFDAHADLMDHFNPPTHEDYLKVLIEERYLDAKQVILVGLRAIDPQEQAYLDERQITYYTMERVRELGTDALIAELDAAVSRWTGGCYLSLDIDVLDPQIAPGTGYPEQQGMAKDDLFTLLDAIKKHAIIGSDLVEINASKDVLHKTSKLGAEIIKILL